MYKFPPDAYQRLLNTNVANNINITITVIRADVAQNVGQFVSNTTKMHGNMFLERVDI